jgi:hypothetical protein
MNNIIKAGGDLQKLDFLLNKFKEFVASKTTNGNLSYSFFRCF